MPPDLRTFQTPPSALIFLSVLFRADEDPRSRTAFRADLRPVRRGPLPLTAFPSEAGPLWSAPVECCANENNPKAAAHGRTPRRSIPVHPGFHTSARPRRPAGLVQKPTRRRSHEPVFPRRINARFQRDLCDCLPHPFPRGQASKWRQGIVADEHEAGSSAHSHRRRPFARGCPSPVPRTGPDTI